ncbi:MAG: hypothetical protein QOG03_1132 [Actinomycetota bacterium]|jgi:hypothetical protein|nr:hypothetical protein [Actinomycetota bacterium]
MTDLATPAGRVGTITNYTSTSCPDCGAELLAFGAFEPDVLIARHRTRGDGCPAAETLEVGQPRQASANTAASSMRTTSPSRLT